jgi:hypothetical protein
VSISWRKDVHPSIAGDQPRLVQRPAIRSYGAELGILACTGKSPACPLRPFGPWRWVTGMRHTSPSRYGGLARSRRCQLRRKPASPGAGRWSPEINWEECGDDLQPRGRGERWIRLGVKVRSGRRRVHAKLAL